MVVVGASAASLISSAEVLRGIVTITVLSTQQQHFLIESVLKKVVKIKKNNLRYSAISCDMQFVNFPPQTTYSDGRIACTSIAWHWAVACLEKLVTPLITASQAEIIFSQAIKAHLYICNRQHGQNKLLSNFELEQYFSHRKMKSSEFNVVSDSISVDKDMRLHWVPCKTLCKMLLHSPNNDYAMIITQNNHTHAIFSTSDNLTCFDSLSGKAVSFDRTAREFEQELRGIVSKYDYGEVAVTLLTK